MSNEAELAPGEIDTEDPKWKLVPNYGRVGKKVFAVAIHERGTTGTGKAQILAHCVVLKDMVKPNAEMDPPDDVGMTFRCKCYPGSPGGMRRLASLIRAHGWKGTVNVESDDDAVANRLAKVWAHGYFVAEVTSEEGQDKKVWYEVDANTAVPYTGEIDPAWKAQIDAAGDKVEKAIADRAEAQASRGSGGSGGRGGGGTRKKAGGDGEAKYGF